MLRLRVSDFARTTQESTCGVRLGGGAAMYQCREWDYAEASAQAWGSGGIALFRARGLVNQETSIALLGDCQAAAREWDVRGLVAQYTDALLGIDADAMLSSAVSFAGARGRIGLPTALVVRRDDLPLWQTYAHLMAQHGILRGVFTDYEAGLQWARRQAEILTADLLDRRIPAFAR